jgi:hypothetical protein
MNRTRVLAVSATVAGTALTAAIAVGANFGLFGIGLHKAMATAPSRLAKPTPAAATALEPQVVTQEETQYVDEPVPAAPSGAARELPAPSASQQSVPASSVPVTPSAPINAPTVRSPATPTTSRSKRSDAHKCDDSTDPHSSKSFDPRTNDSTDPHSSKSFDPHTNDSVDPHTNDSVDPHTNDSVDPRSNDCSQ